MRKPTFELAWAKPLEWIGTHIRDFADWPSHREDLLSDVIPITALENGQHYIFVKPQGD
jgi:hypothetical protein